MECKANTKRMRRAVGGVLQTVSSDRYHVPWSSAWHHTKANYIRHAMIVFRRRVDCARWLSCKTQHVPTASTTAYLRGRPTPTDRPTPPAFAARMISLSALSSGVRPKDDPARSGFICAALIDFHRILTLCSFHSTPLNPPPTPTHSRHSGRSGQRQVDPHVPKEFGQGRAVVEPFGPGCFRPERRPRQLQ